MTATVTRGTATGRPAPARRRAARRRFAFPRASTTPGKVRLVRMGQLVLLVPQDPLVHLDNKDKLVNQETLGQEGQPVYQGHLDQQVPMA